MEEKNFQQNNINKKPEVLRTYLSDMADVVRENEASVIKIALAEQQRKEREDLYREVKKTSWKKVALIIGGIILVLIAIGFSYFLIKEKNKPIETEEQNMVVNTFISYETKSIINLDQTITTSELVDLIKEKINEKGKSGEIKAVFLKEKVGEIENIITLRKFFTLMRTTASASLARSLGDDYFIGAYTSTDETILPFLILKTKNYDITYAGMLTWEKTLLMDLFNFFDIDISGDRNKLLEKPWEDLIINNKDSRILKDYEGNILLYYMFLDKENLIITNHRDTLKEISSRILINKNK